jgi:hypothetical protein
MTHHEILAAAAIAQEEHEKPLNEGGHGGPLSIHCFLEALNENAREVFGLPAGILRADFKASFPRLLEKGWLVICDEQCGGNHFRLTDKGREQLQEWNEHGCDSHFKKAGRKPAKNRCVAPALMRVGEAA